VQHTDEVVLRNYITCSFLREAARELGNRNNALKEFLISLDKCSAYLFWATGDIGREGWHDTSSGKMIAVKDTQMSLDGFYRFVL